MEIISLLIQFPDLFTEWQSCGKPIPGKQLFHFRNYRNGNAWGEENISSYIKNSSCPS